MKLLLFLTFSAITFYSFGQAEKESYYREINRIDSLIQIELDSGTDMLASQKKRYHKLDSLRIVIFKDVRLEANLEKCMSNDEWLKERIELSDSLWGNLYTTYDTSRDSRMFLYADLTEFVRSRIYCLFK